MINPIDWEKHYASLENQLKDMMKMSLKLMDEKDLLIKSLILEEQDDQRNVTVLFKGDTPIFKYDCYDENNHIIYTIIDTFRNTIDITRFKNISKVCVYVKENIEKEYEQNKVINLM